MVTKELLHRFRDKNRNLLDGGIIGHCKWDGDYMTITSDTGNVLMVGGPTLYLECEKRGYIKNPSNPWE